VETKAAGCPLTVRLRPKPGRGIRQRQAAASDNKEVISGMVVKASRQVSARVSFACNMNSLGLSA
jgi:hypothetical protein